MKPSAGGHSGRNRQSARAAAAARQGQDRCRRPGVAAACQDVEDDVGEVDLSPIASARPLHGRETVGQHRRENLDHLKVAVVRALQLVSHALPTGDRRLHVVVECRAQVPRERRRKRGCARRTPFPGSGADKPRTNSIRLWHSRTWVIFTVTVVPLISTTSCDQSNWQASPGAKLSGT